MRQEVMDRLSHNPACYPPVTDDLLKLLVERILTVGKPLKIVFFGSRARGDHRQDSDIDILILEASRQQLEAKRTLYESVLRDLYPERTILVRSIQEAEQWKYVPNYITTEALNQGMVLFEDREQLRPASGGALRVAEDEEPKTQSDLARGWLEKASDDLGACRVLIDSGGHLATACFLAQQSAEKYLKAFLAFYGRSIPKTHNLVELLQECQQRGPLQGPSGLNLDELTTHAIEGRYSLTFRPSQDVAQAAFVIASRIGDAIRSHLPPDAQPVQPHD